MFRSILNKNVFQGQSVKSSIRVFSANAAAAHEVKFEDEWNSAKDYNSIPCMTKLQAIRSFLPGGKYVIDKLKSI